MAQMEGASYDKRRIEIMRSMPRDMLEVTPADIQSLAKQYLTPGASWSAVVLPTGVEAEGVKSATARTGFIAMDAFVTHCRGTEARYGVAPLRQIRTDVSTTNRTRTE